MGKSRGNCQHVYPQVILTYSGKIHVTIITSVYIVQYKYNILKMYIYIDVMEK